MSSRTVSSVRFCAGSSPVRADDRVALEEPLEIRLSGEPFVVTMRTPGHDEELTAGLLHAEGLVRNARQLSASS